jgi:hypothetical protein
VDSRAEIKGQSAERVEADEREEEGAPGALRGGAVALAQERTQRASRLPAIRA